jgi:hypothetical protein
LFTIGIQPAERLLGSKENVGMPREFRHPNQLFDLETYLSSPIMHNDPQSCVSAGGTEMRPGESASSDVKSDADNPKTNSIASSEIPQPRDRPNSEVPTSTSEEGRENHRRKLQFGDGLVCLWSDEMYHRFLGNESLKKLTRMWEGNSRSRGEASHEVPLLCLDDCLDEFSQIETLAGEQAWFCPRCNQIVPAQTSLHLWRVPEILILQLKRFDPVQNRKVDIFVDYPVKDLDLTDRVGDKEWLNDVSKGKRLMYDLFAVGKHFGGLYGGHYAADVYNYLDGNWYDFNGSSISGHNAEIDTWVSPARLDRLVSSSALLLFYKRKLNT